MSIMEQEEAHKAAQEFLQFSQQLEKAEEKFYKLHNDAFMVNLTTGLLCTLVASMYVIFPKSTYPTPTYINSDVMGFAYCGMGAIAGAVWIRSEYLHVKNICNSFKAVKAATLCSHKAVVEDKQKDDFNKTKRSLTKNIQKAQKATKTMLRSLLGKSIFNQASIFFGVLAVHNMISELDAKYVGTAFAGLVTTLIVRWGFARRESRFEEKARDEIQCAKRQTIKLSRILDKSVALS